MKNVIKLTILIYMFGWSIVSDADVIKCKDKEGRITYQQFSCKQGSVQEEVKTAIESPDKLNIEPEEDFVILQKDLIGTWTDYMPRTAYNSTWTFTSSDMILKKYDGRIIRLPYTLTRNQIIVHHKKNLVNKEDWDEEINLISFKNNILVWNSITTVRLHKIF